MRRSLWLLVVGTACIALFAASAFSLPKKLIWNRTSSAPIGLYQLSDESLTVNGWAVVSADSADAKWAQQRGYVGQNWPLIKRVGGLPGDRVCRENETILINDVIVAEALKADNFGRELPDWNDCFTVEYDEVFLLNDHPNSLDGRYFGATHRQDIAGSARLLWSKS